MGPGGDHSPAHRRGRRCLRDPRADAAADHERRAACAGRHRQVAQPGPARAADRDRAGRRELRGRVVERAGRAGRDAAGRRRAPASACGRRAARRPSCNHCWPAKSSAGARSSRQQRSSRSEPAAAVGQFVGSWREYSCATGAIADDETAKPATHPGTSPTGLRPIPRRTRLSLTCWRMRCTLGKLN